MTSPPQPKTTVNVPILVVGLLFIAGLVGVLASGFGKDPRDVFETRLVEEDAAPEDRLPAINFSLPTLDGETVTLSGLQGQPVVLNFWATWCQPCKLEHPYVLAAAEAYQPAGVIFLGVLHQDEPALARRYLKQAGQAFPTVYDDDNSTSIDYGVSGVPETFVIDAQGRIAKKFVGPVSPGEIEAVLKELL